MARRLFTSTGYEGTSLSSIQSEAGVSRGAVYHHFSSKQEVFEAVFVETATAAMQRATADIAKGLTSRETLVSGCLNWLNEVDDAEVAEIVLVMAPEVLGWARARELEELYSLGLIKTGLTAAIHSGEVDQNEVHPIEMTARLINAILAEVALAVQVGDIARQEAGPNAARAIDRLLG